MDQALHQEPWERERAAQRTREGPVGAGKVTDLGDTEYLTFAIETYMNFD